MLGQGYRPPRGAVTDENGAVVYALYSSSRGLRRCCHFIHGLGSLMPALCSENDFVLLYFIFTLNWTGVVGVSYLLLWTSDIFSLSFEDVALMSVPASVYFSGVPVLWNFIFRLSTVSWSKSSLSIKNVKFSFNLITVDLRNSVWKCEELCL